MTIAIAKERYVAQIDLPAPVYAPASEQKSLGTPYYYGCSRGYWSVFFDKDALGTNRPLGIRLTAEFYDENREGAEDRALNSGSRLATVLGAYSGSPLPSPRLHRLARIGPSDGILEQNDYYYLEGPDELPRVFLRTYNLDKLIRWFGELETQASDRLERAARWYGMSLKAEDSLDGYLSVWIGLESAGPPLSMRVHKMGPKAECPVCKNPTGKDRNRGDAGIEHAIKAVAPELLKERSLQQLKDIRNDIAHALKQMESLRVEARHCLADLQLSLIFAILTAVRPDTEAPGSGRAILPRDFQPYPDARATVLSPVELIKQRPYFGEWLQIDRQLLEPTRAGWKLYLG